MELSTYFWHPVGAGARSRIKAIYSIESEKVKIHSPGPPRNKFLDSHLRDTLISVKRPIALKTTMTNENKSERIK